MLVTVTKEMGLAITLLCLLGAWVWASWRLHRTVLGDSHRWEGTQS